MSSINTFKLLPESSKIKSKFLYNSGHALLKINAVTIICVSENIRNWNIDQVWSKNKTVRIDVDTKLHGQNRTVIKMSSHFVWSQNWYDCLNNKQIVFVKYNDFIKKFKI